MPVIRHRGAKMGGKPGVGCTDWICGSGRRQGEGEGGNCWKKRAERAQESWGITKESGPVRSHYLWDHLQLAHGGLSKILLDCGPGHSTAQSSSHRRLWGSAWALQQSVNPNQRPTLKKHETKHKMATVFISLTQTPQASLPQRTLIPTLHMPLQHVTREKHASLCCKGVLKVKYVQESMVISVRPN